MKIFHIFFLLIILSVLSCNNEKRSDDKSTNEIDSKGEKKLTVDSEIISVKSMGMAYLEENDLENAEIQFRRFIELAPADASGYANLGVVFLRQGKNDDAEIYLKKAVELAPDNPEILLNLAKVYELKDNKEASLDVLKKTEEIAPEHIKTLYSLAEKYEGAADAKSLAQWENYMQKVVTNAPRNIVARLYLIEALLRNRKSDEALKNLEVAQQIYPEFPLEAQEYFTKSVYLLQNKKTNEALTSILIFHNFLKLTPEYQGGIRELKGTQGAATGIPVISMKQSSTVLQDGESILEVMKFSDATSGAGLDLFNSGKLNSASEYISNISVGDMDGDGDQDIYFSGYEINGNQTFQFLLQSEFGRYKDITQKSNISHSGMDNSSRFVDYNNDGFPDLFISNNNSDVLYKNVSEGVFADETSQSGIKGAGFKSLFLDLDHEGDLDLITAKKGKNAVYRNTGIGIFDEFPAVSDLSKDSYDSKDLAFGDFDGDGDIDVVVANADGPCQLFSNLRQGKLIDQTAGSGLDPTIGIESLEVADYDNDGQLDILNLTRSAGINLFRNKGDGTFELSVHSTPINQLVKDLTCLDATIFDFDNDGLSDLLFIGRPLTNLNRGIVLLHNDGNGFSDVSNLIPEHITNGRQLVLSDYNQDGDLDIFLVELNGAIRLLRNDGGNTNHHIKIQLVGLRTGSGKNNHFGIGAEVEVRAGDLYQKKIITEPGLLFGIGSREKLDVVRILWTNGVPQNIFSPGTDQDLIEEQELKGSCPFLYTWNGTEYAFVKDMMWRSALGMPLGIMGGKATFAFADASVEYLKIPGEMLHEKDGKYSIQITEELWETIYCDEIKLIAVDHPADADVYVDEKFAAPPYPGLKVYNVKNHQIPMTAVDGAGIDLLEIISKKDDQYVSNFQRSTYQGVTEMKDLIMDLGDIPDTKNLHLFLNGWIFPTDASINVAISQSDNLKIKPPALEVINAKGDWQEVIPSIGFPAGKNKTVVVDLSNIFLSKERKVRIRTNMEIYWDYVFFAQDENMDIDLTTMNPETADYHYRGFSRSYRKEGRYGPHWFDYSDVSTGQKWRDLTGTYTRYGDVTELLQSADDKYIIANAGDETTIGFDATKLPKLQQGWKRDFLIYSVGWVKDGDLNTALGQTVEPLPFHGMSQYPYGKNEHYPVDKTHKAYQEKYNTRVVGTEDFKGFVSKEK